MTNEERLETVVNWYRQQLADVQLQVASNNATIQELNAELTEANDELEKLRVQQEEANNTGSAKRTDK